VPDSSPRGVSQSRAVLLHLRQMQVAECARAAYASFTRSGSRAWTISNFKSACMGLAAHTYVLCFLVPPAVRCFRRMRPRAAVGVEEVSAGMAEGRGLVLALCLCCWANPWLRAGFFRYTDRAFEDLWTAERAHPPTQLVARTHPLQLRRHWHTTAHAWRGVGSGRATRFG
jgi:hypothetical protein